MTWPSTRLADLCEVITKGTTPTTIGFDFSDRGVPFLRVQNIDGGSVNYERETLFIDERTHKALGRSQIWPGDVLVSIAGTIGRSGVVPQNAPPLNCNQAVAIVRTNGSVFQPFLRHWLESSNAQAQMHGATVTGTISNLSLTQIGNLRIPLPPLEKQRWIAEILDRAEALRAKRRGALAQINTLTQTIFLDLFGDPVSNPKGWPQTKLGGLIASGPQNGLYKPAHDYGSGTAILRIDSFYDGVVTGFTDLKRVQISDQERELYCLHGGDIVVNRVNSMEYLGKSALIPNLEEPTVFESNMMRFDVDRKLIEPRYLIQFLQSRLIKIQILNAAKNAVNQSSINQQDVKGFTINVPPLPLQREFIRCATAVKKLKIAQQASLNEIDALFAALQHRAFQRDL